MAVKEMEIKKKVFIIFLDLYAIPSEAGRRPVPVFLELGRSRQGEESRRSNPVASAPGSGHYLALPGHPAASAASPNPSARLHAGANSARQEQLALEDLTQLHLLGRVCIEPTQSTNYKAHDLRARVKQLFHVSET